MNRCRLVVEEVENHFTEITIEEIKIVLMGLKKRLKKAKGKETQERFQTKIDRWELFLANIPETADAQVEITLEED